MHSFLQFVKPPFPFFLHNAFHCFFFFFWFSRAFGDKTLSCDEDAEEAKDLYFAFLACMIGALKSWKPKKQTNGRWALGGGGGRARVGERGGGAVARTQFWGLGIYQCLAVLDS